MKVGKDNTMTTCKKCKKKMNKVTRNGIPVSRVHTICLKTSEKIKKTKQKKKSWYVKELDRVFSIYIRKSSADKNGNILCACCNKLVEWQQSQNMHYISRSHMATRFDELNCHPGCVACNVFKNGNYPAYTEFYLKTYGHLVLESLLRRKNVIRQWTIPELEEKINYYKSKI